MCSRSFSLVILALAAALLGHSCSGPNQSAELDLLIRSYLDFYWESFPERATAQGIHLYDRNLAPSAEEDFRHQAQRVRELQASLADIDQAALDFDGQVDRRLLESILEARLLEIEEVGDWTRDPNLYLPFQGLNQLVVGRFASSTIRARSLIKRLEQVPRVFADAQKNLKNPPQLLTETAIRSAEKMRAFYESGPAGLAEKAPTLKPALIEASQKAVRALDDFILFLKNDLLPRSQGEIALGRRLYDLYLSRIHMLDDDADSLLAKGLAAFEEIERELEKVAAELDPLSTWQEITEALRFNHPSKDELLRAYCREIRRAKKHVLDHKLVTLPPGEEVKCLNTPESQRAFSPFGTFQAPAPFAEEKTGFLLLHPIPEGLSPEEEEHLLRAHDFTWISVIAPHETYPGHHVQALKAQENPRLLRQVHTSPLFSEGWGLYSEELAYETGFFRTPLETRLTQLRLRLWRAARVILDVRLHTGQIDFEQARRFLIDKVRFDETASAGEVNIYLRRPTYVISYLIGFQEILKLRREYKLKRGSKYSLGEFHDRLLTQGSMPLPLMRRLLLEAD